jgi:hypothetical protein
MRTRRILAALVGSAMALTLAGAAFATDLHQDTPISIGDVDANTLDCTADEIAALEGAGATTAWHFILIGPFTGDTSTGTLDATFSDPTDTASVTGTLNGNALSFYVWNSSNTLESASTTGVDGTLLNLSHTCQIPAPTPTPTLPPTSTVPVTPASPTGTSMNLVLGLILLIAGGITAYAMRPRRSTR